MKRFYTDVSTEAHGDMVLVKLDGRIVKTPGQEELYMPTQALAEAVAEEWRTQGEDIDTSTMPISTLANTAIDRVQPRRSIVAQDIANFAGTDMLCYRADEPPALAAQQAALWDPYLKWATDVLNAPLKTTSGIMPIQQEQSSLDAITDEVFACGAFELTALHEFTNGFGSVVLALAYMKEFSSFGDLWQASILDQQMQEESWGTDFEAIEKKENLLAELNAACRFLSLVRD